MKETDELRRVAAKTECANGRCEKLYRGDLERIADRIDAEHERAMADAELAAAPTEVQLEEWGYVKLPVDAEGKPIRIGDVMEWCDSGETLTVEGIGRDVLFYIDGENVEWTAARNKRHYHAPTVEDVLREFADEVQRCCDTEDTIAEYAAKLRLAEKNEDACE